MQFVCKYNKNFTYCLYKTIINMLVKFVCIHTLSLMMMMMQGDDDHDDDDAMTMWMHDEV